MQQFRHGRRLRTFEGVALEEVRAVAPRPSAECAWSGSAASTSLSRDPGPPSPTRSGEVVTKNAVDRVRFDVAGLAEDAADSIQERAQDDVGSDAPAQAQAHGLKARVVRGARPACSVRTSTPDASNGLFGVDLAASCEDGDLGAADAPRRSRTAYSDAEGRRRSIRVSQVPLGLARHSGADEHGVRERAQETHHEPIIAVPGDELVRAPHRRDRDGAVDGRDEVGVHGRRMDQELSVVTSRRQQ